MTPFRPFAELGLDDYRSGLEDKVLVEAFVRAAATGLPHGHRINAVSPTAFVETWQDYAPYFPGFAPVPVTEAALAYLRSIGGVENGRVYRVGY